MKDNLHLSGEFRKVSMEKAIVLMSLHELKRWGMETWNIQGKGKFRKNTITMQIEVQKRVNHV